MKLSRLFRCWCLAGAIALVPQVSEARLLLEDYFEYTPGDLAGQGEWLKIGTQAGSQLLNVVQSPLTYAGYQDAPRGNAAKITYSEGDDKLQDRDCGIPMVDQADAFKSGKLYASFLINVSDPSADAVYSVGFTQGIATTGMVAGKAVTEYGKLWVMQGTEPGTCKLGITMTSGTPKSFIDNVSLNETHLVVIGFEFTDAPSGQGGDTAALWVDPATGSTEAPTEGRVEDAATAQVSRKLGLQGFSLRQGTTGTKHGSTFVLDALRIGTEWTDLFPAQGGEEKPVETAIKVNPQAINFTPNGSSILQGMTAESRMTVRGTGLKGDITITSSDPSLRVEPATVSAADAMSDAGAIVTVAYTATSTTALSGSLTLSSEGAPEVAVPVSAAVTAVPDKSSFAFLNNQSEAGGIYRYTGSMAKISYVDQKGKAIYIQDPAGAIKIDCQYIDSELQYSVGDKLKNMYLMRTEETAVYQPIFPAIGTLASSGNTVTPSEATFSEIKADPESYLYRLLTITDVTLSPSAGAVWSQGTVVASDAKGSGRVGVFAGTDLDSQTVPTSAKAITGISTSTGAPVLKMRGSVDLTTAESKAPELTIETISSGEDLSGWLAIGKTYNLGTMRVTYSGLTADAEVYVGGANRAMFSLSTETLPAGSGTVDIAVSYTPTSVGVHKGNVTINATPTELSTSRSITAKAYDPAKLPSVAVSTEELKGFVAKVGEIQKQTISYTVTNGLDYGSIKVEPAGAFLISSASLLKSGTGNLEISYKPQAAGTHTATITFTSPMAPEITVEVSGTASGETQAETKQGDELTFGGVAQTVVSTDFTTDAATNTAIKLDGWVNSAVEGTRAWWSYTDSETGNKMAKATLYDSKAEVSTPATMVLLSPRLNYNTERRLLCFNIMGKFLGSNADAKMGVAYVDAKYADAHPDAPVFSMINGLNIPSTAEENGNWAKYVLDTENWQLDDEFYIAFVMEGSRGTENAATYFVDDFSWGRTDVPFIRTSHQLFEQTAVANAEHTSPELTITGFNLDAPIEVSLSGTHAKNFTASTQQLPAEGGQLSLKFLSDATGDHSAVLSLKSGDSQSHILLNYNVGEPTGVEGIASETGKVVVSDLMGRVVLNGVSMAEAKRYMDRTPGSVYVVVNSEGKATKYTVR